MGDVQAQTGHQEALQHLGQHVPPREPGRGSEGHCPGTALLLRELVEAVRGEPRAQQLLRPLAFGPFSAPWGQRSGWLRESLRGPGIRQEGICEGQGGSGSLASSR